MNNSCKIVYIESGADQVRIDFRYTNRHGYGGWVRMNPKCFIRPVGTELVLTMLRSEGIPISPKILSFNKNGDILFYSLFFPPLPENVTEIDIIEEEEEINSFNFYNVSTLNKKISMTTNTTTVLKNIEKMALELKGDRKEIKSFFEDLKRLDISLSELADFLKLSNEETAIFCLATYMSITNDSFSIAEMKSDCNFSPFDFFEIKKIVKSLLKKGWIVKSGSASMHRGRRRIEEKLYYVSPGVLDALYKDITPEIKIKEIDVYTASEMLHKCLTEHCEDSGELDELYSMLLEFEEENPNINPFKITNELNLDRSSKIILYCLVGKMSAGEEQLDVDRMLSNFFSSHSERAKLKRMLSQRENILFENNLIEFTIEDFKTDKYLKLTAEGVKLVFGEDACFLSKEDVFSSGICKLIKHDSIVEKELFYNENEQQSIDSVSAFLNAEKFTDIVKRLEENKMRPGLTILLHGYPGTGKTETIYQLARQTKRNILLVNISEIRDKWVGESEKRLKSVFETYKNSFKRFEEVPILLFNESDALIGKRINVNSSVDQMNNAMQNILLQELEDFKGILMATTNLTANLDEAFERRFLFKIKYSRPSQKAKEAIWKSKLNFLSDEDSIRLAEEFDFSGGQIENISRKLFLDILLHGKKYSLEDTIQYCEEESLLNDSGRKKVGFL